MNKKNLSLKVDEYTIYLHRGQEESEEIGTTSKQYVFLLIIELQSFPWFTLYHEYVCDNIYKLWKWK